MLGEKKKKILRLYSIYPDGPTYTSFLSGNFF